MEENHNVQDESIFNASVEAIAAADAALGAIADRSFSARNAVLGKMVNCQICHRRHRKTDVTYRQHFAKDGTKTVTIEPLISECKQVFKQLWIDEDLETGELSVQYAIVPLPGQNGTPKSIVGAAYFAKKRKNPHPSRRKLQFIRLVRKLTPDEYTQDDLNTARQMAAELLGLNKRYVDKLPRRKDWNPPKKEVNNGQGTVS